MRSGLAQPRVTALSILFIAFTAIRPVIPGNDRPLTKAHYRHHCPIKISYFSDGTDGF